MLLGFYGLSYAELKFINGHGGVRLMGATMEKLRKSETAFKHYPYANILICQRDYYST